MSQGNTHSEDQIRDKMGSYKIKVTSYLTGVGKNKFMLDLLKKGSHEGELIRNILDIHYSIIEVVPHLKELEFDEIKKYLLDKIKLK